MKKNYKLLGISTMLSIVILILTLSPVVAMAGEEETPVIATNIFIGDSRTVMMYFAEHSYDTKSRIEIDELDNNGEYWKAKGASEFAYMRDTAIPAMERYIGDGTNIFILFGVNNDNNPAKVDDYAELLNVKSKEWYDKGADVYYVSVNPVDDNTVWFTGTMGYCTEWIEEWNRLALEKFDWTYMTYIDTYNEIGDELVEIDGVHYSHASSRVIYDFLIKFDYKCDNEFCQNGGFYTTTYNKGQVLRPMYESNLIEKLNSSTLILLRKALEENYEN